MRFFLKRYEYLDFNDEIEHSVSPASDYPFATEFYNKKDSRYKLVKAFEKLVFETKGVRIFNCKIQIPTLATNIYNIYVYLNDVKKELGESYNPFFNRNEDFIELFNQALLKYPVKEISNKKLNANGIFIQDFHVCAKAYAISSAFRNLEKALKQRYPLIKYLTYWDTTIYVFFPEYIDFNDFLNEENVKEFKQFSYRIIKPFDAENVWTADTLSFMLDDYINYSSIGGQHYFNSSAMSAGIFI